MKEMFLDCARRAGVDAEGEAKVAEVVASALASQKPIIDDVLDTRLLNEELFLENLSQKLRIGWEENLEREEAKPRQLRELCSAQVALRHRLLPIWFDDPNAADEDEDGGGAKKNGSNGKAKLQVATYDPFNLAARQAASQHIKVPVEWRMASRTRIISGLQSLYGVGADTFEQLLAGREMDADLLDSKEEKHDIGDDDDEEASVVKFVNTIIREALVQRATDIHVEPMENDLRIRYRVDGLLLEVPVPENIKSLQSMVIARLKIMSRLDIAERRLPQDGRIALQIDGKSIDVRVATIPVIAGEQVSLRLLGQDRFTLDKLGALSRIRKIFDNLLEMSNGVVLLTGPTGCGKSTTLYTFLSVLNKPEDRIVTVEDPVENKLEGVMQIAVRPEINLTFANGLRSILRADPDIVMVGEIRDIETAEIAIRAALTGHLVFSTLHTNGSIGGITRLVNMGVEPFLVAASVRAFIAQRLVRKLCPDCRKPTSYPDKYLRSVAFPENLSGTFYQAGKCQNCRHTGFRGRLAVYETCVVTPPVQELITSRRSETSIKEQCESEGFINMRGYGFEKVLLGETTLEEVLSATQTEMAAVE